LPVFCPSRCAMVVETRLFVRGPKIGSFLRLLVFIETKENKAFLFSFLIQLFEIGKRFAAGSIPSGPKKSRNRGLLRKDWKEIS